MARFVVALSLTLLITSFVGAQTPNPTPVKNATALAEIEAAITAMGGDAAAIQISDSVVTGTITPTTGSWVKPATFIWKTSGPEFRYEIQRDSGNQIFASGHGKPAVSRNGNIKPLFYHMIYGGLPFHLPMIILATKITDSTTSLTDAGTVTVLAKSAYKVQINTGTNSVDASTTQQVWYCEATSHLPLRVEYRLPEATDMNQWTDAAAEFSDFRPVNGVLIPFTMTYYQGGVALSVLSISTVNFNVGIDPAEFDLLGGVQ